jgi:hypothetical protein
VKRAASAFAVDCGRVDCLMGGNQPPGPPWRGLWQVGKTGDIREAVETEYASALSSACRPAGGELAWSGLGRGPPAADVR